MLTPTIDLFSSINIKNNLQEKVVESQNGAVVLDGGVAAIAITVFGKTVFFLGLNGHLKRPGDGS